MTNLLLCQNSCLSLAIHPSQTLTQQRRSWQEVDGSEIMENNSFYWHLLENWLVISRTVIISSSFRDHLDSIVNSRRLFLFSVHKDCSWSSESAWEPPIPNMLMWCYGETYPKSYFLLCTLVYVFSALHMYQLKMAIRILFLLLEKLDYAHIFAHNPKIHFCGPKTLTFAHLWDQNNGLWVAKSKF